MTATMFEEKINGASSEWLSDQSIALPLVLTVVAALALIPLARWVWTRTIR